MQKFRKLPLGEEIARDLVSMYLGKNSGTKATSQLWRAAVAKKLIEKGINDKALLKAFITGNAADIDKVQTNVPTQPHRTTIPKAWQPPAVEARHRRPFE